MASKEQLINKRVGRIIARKRKAAGFTQDEVADKLGIGAEAFSRIERGLNSPGIHKLYELADIFQCGVDTFLVEGSRRSYDQVELMLRSMERLPPVDRQFVLNIVESLTNRLKKDQRPVKAKADPQNYKDSDFLV